RCFRVDYENNVFLKDDEPFQFVSGSFHYFRVLKDSWKDRLLKMKNGGLNVVQTYVEWSGHEPEPQQYNFEGNYDIETFLKLAQEVGLFVVLRPGPYISAERDNGGLPYWLLRENPRMVYRSFDPTFMLPVDRWFHYFLPMIKDHMYHNGGPIIMVQVENEYGEYKECDCRYMEHLVYIFLQHLGTDTVLYRQDYPLEENYICDEARQTFVSGSFKYNETIADVFDIMNKSQGNEGPMLAKQPLTFEDIGQCCGYVVYSTVVNFDPDEPAKLSVPGLRDRGYLLTKTGVFVMSSEDKVLEVEMSLKRGDSLWIVVENEGRINRGRENHDPKGIIAPVTLNRKVLEGWTMEPVPITKEKDILELETILPGHDDHGVPGFFYGTFTLKEGQSPEDTFLDPSGWTKGVAFLNGFNLGRYWPTKGPQVTLYVPGSLLKPRPEVNTIILLEMEGAPSDMKIGLVDKPTL
ncbi:unnamed protein product, partial [Ixodes persulcatus]